MKAPSELYSTVIRTGCPAARCTSALISALPSPKNASPGGGGSVIPSMTGAPSTRTFARPTWTMVMVWTPVDSGVRVAVARAVNRPGSVVPGTSPVRRSLPSLNPSTSIGSPDQSSPSKYSTLNPSPRSRVGTGRAVRSVTAPGSYRTATEPSRDSSASSGVVSCSGLRAAEPPPMIIAEAALGPITARLVRAAGSRGRRPSFERSTMPSADALRTRARCLGMSSRSSGRSMGSSNAPVRSMSRSRRRTDPSSTASSTSPCSTAATRDGPKKRPRPGISRVRPALAEAAVDLVPNQSLTTTPSNPHSSNRTAVSRSRCSQAKLPFTLL